MNGRARGRRTLHHYDGLFSAADLGDAVQAASRACPGIRHIFNQYVIRTRQRDELRAHLAANGIGTEIYYPLPLHAQRCFAYLEHEPDDFPRGAARGRRGPGAADLSRSSQQSNAST